MSINIHKKYAYMNMINFCYTKKNIFQINLIKISGLSLNLIFAKFLRNSHKVRKNPINIYNPKSKDKNSKLINEKKVKILKYLFQL